MPQQVLSLRGELGLTDEQVSELNELHVAIREERHRYSHSGGKPYNTVHQAMITREQAYVDAMAVLTPEQRPKGHRAAHHAAADRQGAARPRGLEAA